MPRSSASARLAAVAALLLSTACADDDGPAAPQGADAAALNADVAQATGAGVASDLAVMAGSEAAVAAGFADAGAPHAGTCTRSANTLTCNGGREGTLTVQRTVTFLDAAGAEQTQYDATTTASIRFTAQVSGSASGPQFTSMIERARASTVSGLAGAETQRTWNGTGTATVQSTFTGVDVTRSHRMLESDTTTNVVWTVAPRAAWPASGTVVRRVAVTTEVSGARTHRFSAVRRVQVTFNGTPQVPLQVAAVTRRGTTVELTCQLDLATRVVACPERE
jgi:hypothetical protein